MELLRLFVERGDARLKCVSRLTGFEDYQKALSLPFRELKYFVIFFTHYSLFLFFILIL
jgi:hypothetical protein